MSLLQELEEIESQARAGLEAAQDESQLDTWWHAFLGRRGRLTQILRALAALPLEERRVAAAREERAGAQEPGYPAQLGVVLGRADMVDDGQGRKGQSRQRRYHEHEIASVSHFTEINLIVLSWPGALSLAK